MPGGQNGYDVIAHLPAGQVLTRDRTDALVQAYVDNGRQPLSADQVTAAVGPALPAITSIKRLPDESTPSQG
jgi:hypothetical protein